MKKLKNVPQTMLEVVSRAAEDERAEKSYQNHTFELVNSTQAVLVSGGADAQVDLVMATPYASYVEEKGLSTIDEQYERAKAELVIRFNA